MSTRQLGWALLCWTGLGMLTATQTVLGMRSEGMNHNWTRLFLVFSLDWLPWALATPLVMWMGRRMPFDRWIDIKSLAWHVGLLLAMGWVYALWGAELRLVLRPWGNEPKETPSLPAMVWSRMSGTFHISVLVYGALIALGRSLESRRQLAQAQLAALRKQLEPHFLFNTLNGITGMVREGKNEEAVTMIARLSDLLRQVLEGSDRQMGPLGDEVEFLVRYLEIQQMRLGDRLTVRVDVEQRLRTLPVPSLILQPLVENAIQHGVAKRLEGGRVWIEAEMRGKELLLRVGNDGPGLKIGREGVGLTNTRARIWNLYGKGAGLELKEMGGGSIEAELRLPVAGVAV